MTNKLYEAMDRGNLGQMGDAFRKVKLGTLLCLMPVFLYGAVPTATPAGKLAAEDAILLPVNAKAFKIHSAYARAGTGTKGPLTIVADGTAPSAGECAISPDGDIVFNATDAWTKVDVVYIPAYQEVVEDLELTVTSDVATIPSRYADRCIGLLKAESTGGTVEGRFYVDKPGGTLATKECALALTKGTIAFKTTDAVSSCKVTLALSPLHEPYTELQAESALLL